VGRGRERESDRADASDLDDLAALRHRWRTEASGEAGHGRDGFAAQFREWYGAHAASHRPYLVSVSGEAVGCAWLMVVDRIPGPGRFLRRAGIVQSVYVAPEHRNQGVGEALLRVVIDNARAMGLEYLMVHPSARSPSLYQRVGFAGAEQTLELRLPPGT